MLSRYFEQPGRIREIRLNCAGLPIDEFAEQLFQRGYSEIAARRHIRSAEHISHWATVRGITVPNLDASAVKRFGGHLSRCRCGRYFRAVPIHVIAGARLFLSHLQGNMEPAIRGHEPALEEPDLLKEFSAWMRAQRGTQDQTLYNYSIPIRALLRHIGEDPNRLSARLVRLFVLKHCSRIGWAAAKRCTTAVRAFLRFLVAGDRCRASLLGAVPVIAHWRLASLPRYLDPADVERMIDSCDARSPMGKRDRAILLLLARLGLRAGDIVQMRLADIDWKGAWIHVSGKSRRETRLPLSREVGQALVAYLQDGRPASDADAMFLRSRAPFRALGNHCAVSVIVSNVMRRAGIKRPGRGAAHLLRHSVATSMLRQGASLQEISALLRHRSVETTQIYAKVDVKGLQQIAQAWPGVRS